MLCAHKVNHFHYDITSKRSIKKTVITSRAKVWPQSPQKEHVFYSYDWLTYCFSL